jgi:hypothetical protein
LAVKQNQPSHYLCYRCGSHLYEKQTYFFRISGDRITPFCSVRCVEAWLTWAEHAYEKCDTGLPFNFPQKGQKGFRTANAVSTETPLGKMSVKELDDILKKRYEK